MGQAVRIREDCAPYSYEALQEEHPKYEQLVLARMDADTAVVRLRKLGFKSVGPQAIAKYMNPLNEEAACTYTSGFRVYCKTRS